MNPVRLAIDVDGGDFGAQTLISGLGEAAERYTMPLTVHLCGHREVTSRLLSQMREIRATPAVEYVIEHCSQKITVRDQPSRAWKSKSHSSIARCIALQKEGVVDVTLSAGDTRFLMAASMFILGRREGVVRPALAAFIPTISQKPVLLLDVGANLGCRAEHLAAFGRMGAEYVRSYLGVDAPTIALLNIGREPSKGPKPVREADALLRDTPGYAGFIEGDGILRGDVDVIVCDGFSGNLLLKACESFYKLVLSYFTDSQELIHQVREKIAVFNPELYGAVPLLGINGLVFKAHGSSKAPVIANALLTAIRMAEHKLSATNVNQSGGL